MVKNSAASLLTSVDDLFTTQEERDEAKRETIMEIPLSQISDFPNHPFKVREDESMSDLVESVKSYGVLSPVIVRPKKNGEYEMIAGHRRKRASELAGKDSIKCIVQDVTDDEAMPESLHSIAEDVAADGLDDILNELRSVGFNALPLF